MVYPLLQTPLQVALEQSSGASLAALLWEWLVTFDDEVAWIWSKNNTSWLKWIFIFARYFILTAQIASRAIAMAIRYENGINIRALKIWYSSQVLVAALSVSALEIVLMSRVYALYNQNRWLGTLLVFCLFLENIMAVVGLVLNWPGDDFIPPAILTHLPESFAYLGISSVVVQTIVLIFTLRKYRRSFLSTIPLVKLMMRDGSLAFLLSSIFGLTVVVYAIADITYAVTAYAWHLSAMSCITCRLIINMQKVPLLRHEGADTSTTIIFTSIFTNQIELEIDEFMNQSLQSRSYASRRSRGRVRQSINRGEDVSPIHSPSQP